LKKEKKSEELEIRGRVMGNRGMKEIKRTRKIMKLNDWDRSRRLCKLDRTRVNQFYNDV